MRGVSATGGRVLDGGLDMNLHCSLLPILRRCGV